MRDMRELIRRLADEGITVLLSSHQLPEVQELCDRVAIVDRGRVVYEGALADLRRQGGAGYRLRSTDDARALEVLRAQPGVEHAVRGEHGLSFQAQESDVGALSLALARAGIGILALTPELATLEDLFFRLTEKRRPARRSADRRWSERDEQRRRHAAAGAAHLETSGVAHARRPSTLTASALGAAQARLPEAHLPGSGRWPPSCR